MLIPNKKSFIQLVLDEEIATFKKDYIDSNVDMKIESPVHNGSVLFKVPLHRSSTKSLLEDLRAPVKEFPVKANHFDKLFKNVSVQVIDIPVKGDFKKCLGIIAKYRAKLGNNFYGALLRDARKKSVILNPFHVVSAISFLSDDDYLSRRKYSVLIYFYSDRAAMDKEYKTSSADLEKTEKSVNTLQVLLANRLATETKIVGIREIEHSPGEFVVKRKIKLHPDEDIHAQHYLSAHQILTNNIVIPFYGSSIIEMKDGTGSRGSSISPFRSANISGAPDDISSATAEGFGNVCTGSMSNKTLEGLRTLHAANMLSPYNRYVLLDGCLAYVDTMINKSFEIYVKAGILEHNPDLFTTPVEIKPYTDEELTCESLKEYMTLRKYSPTDIATAQEEWQKLQDYKNTLTNNIATSDSVEASEISETETVPEVATIDNISVTLVPEEVRRILRTFTSTANSHNGEGDIISVTRNNETTTGPLSMVGANGFVVGRPGERTAFGYNNIQDIEGANNG